MIGDRGISDAPIPVGGKRIMRKIYNTKKYKKIQKNTKRQKYKKTKRQKNKKTKRQKNKNTKRQKNKNTKQRFNN